MRSALLVVICLLSSPVASAQEADDRVERMEKGEVIITASRHKRSGATKLKAVGLIKAPAAKLWAIVDKCDNYTKTMRRVRSSKEIWRKGNQVKCDVVLAMPFPLKDIRTITVATHTEKGGVFKRAWKQVEGGMKINQGSWTLKPYNGGKHTVAVYRVTAEPKVAIPDMIRQAAQKKTIPQLFQHLRKQVE